MIREVLEIGLCDLSGATVVAPRGVLDLVGYARLRDTLLKVGLDEPAAVVVDLNRLTLPDSSVALFTAVAEQLDRWPGVPLLVAARGSAKRAALARCGLPLFVPVHASVEAAVAAVGDPPVRRIARHTLPNSLHAGGVARRFVHETCDEWRVGGAEKAALVATEFVENTVVHTYCAPSMRLELRRGLLTVAVYDDDPTSPRDRGGQPDTGRGLWIVATLAAAWGSAPTATGGKVVWAVVRMSRV